MQSKADMGSLEPTLQDVRETTYVELLGKPKYVNQMPWSVAAKQKTACVHIYVYDFTEELDCWIMLTSGMSDGRQVADGRYYRMELVAYSEDEPTTAQLNALRFIGEYPSRFGSSFLEGDIVSPTNPPRPVFPDATIEQFWLLNPPIWPLDGYKRKLNADGILSLDEKTNIELLWMHTVTAAEAAYRKEYGSDDLIDVMFPGEDSDPFYLDFKRKSCI